MSEENEKPKCDIDDLMCQLKVQNLLGGMKELLGSEKFKVRYPEFEGLGETVAERIREQEITIREAFERCGMPAPEEEKIPPAEELVPMISEEEA